MLLIILWTVVLSAAVVLYFRQTYSRFSRHGVKTFRPLPFVGNMGKVLLKVDHLVDDLICLYNSFPEERFVGRYEFEQPSVVIRDLELIKQITIKDFESFLDHRVIIDTDLDPFFGRNLFSMKGQEWKDMRSTLSPAFTSSKMRYMVPFMVEVGDQMIKSLKKNIIESGDKYLDVDCKDLTTRYSNDVIASCAFGLKVDSQVEQNNQFYQRGKEASTFKFKQLMMFIMMASCPRLVTWLKWSFFPKPTQDYFRKLVISTMENREEQHIIRPDMIHLLMEVKKGRLTHEDKIKDEDAGFATVEESAVGKKVIKKDWSNDDLIAQAVIFFIAGFDTVSIGMCFTLFELARNPEVQEKLVQEIKENDAITGGKFDYTSIQNLRYLDMIVSETFRLWPPAIFLDRRCNKDYNLGKPNDKADEDFIMILLILWTVIFGAAVVLYYRQRHSRFSKHGVKNFRPLPIIGNMGQVLFRVQHFVDDVCSLYNAFPGERFVGKYEFGTPVLMINDLDLIKRIAIKDFEYFLDHRVIISNDLDPIVGRTLVSLKGEEWKDMRSALSPAFTSSKIRYMLPFMVEVGDQMTSTLKKQIKGSSDGYIDLECKDLAAKYANDVIASCAFGLKVNSHIDENNQFYQRGKEAISFKFRQLIMFFVMLFAPKIAKVMKWKLFSQEFENFFRELVLDTMRDRDEKHIIRPDMIHLLMEAKKGRLTHEDNTTKDKDAGFATVEESSLGKKVVTKEWTDEDLIAQAIIFFFAGFETVSVAMCFTLLELALNPDVQERLVEEIKENDVKTGGKFDYNSIQNLQYLDMVISETLRLWPPGIALDRFCNKDYNLGKPNAKATEDYIIHKGEGIAIPVVAIHRDPRYFPDPEKFDPERFSDENKHTINPFSYIPFGVGPRNCIGSRFALCEVKVMVYQLLQHFEIEISDKTILPITLDKSAVSLKVKGGQWMRFKLRE